MIKPIMNDVFFLRQKSEPATEADKQVGKDLIDTLAAHKHECVGMDSNMIGVRPCTCYKEITVEYQDMAFKKHTQVFKEWTAQIIQHGVRYAGAVGNNDGYID